MKKLLFLGLVCVTIGFTSCSKDQKAVKQLDGTWKATKMVFNDTDPESEMVNFNALGGGGSFTMTFDNCKLKKDEWCNGTTIFTYGGGVLPTENDKQLYRITDDGKVLELKEVEDPTIKYNYEIIELTETSLKLKEVDGTFTSEVELSKN